MLSRLINANLKPKLTLTSNLISKRWSGHNAMDIEPSNYGWKHMKDMIHLYTMISIVPLAVITTIINIRANPELTEIPEGYQPRYWEYYKHPIARFVARHFFNPMEYEYELHIANCQYQAESAIMQKIIQNADKSMRFYNDHRSIYFRPAYAEWFRIGRDDAERGIALMASAEGEYYEKAYNPDVNPVPTEGYKPKGSN